MSGAPFKFKQFSVKQDECAMKVGTDAVLLGAWTFRKEKALVKTRLNEIYSLFPLLSDRRAQKASYLSGGALRMLCMGKEIMTKPKMLLLDEPSLGLAPIVVSTIFKVIQELNQNGLPILLVEQNVRAAMQISNRGYVLETGSVVIEGTCEDLLKDEKIVKAYMGA